MRPVAKTTSVFGQHRFLGSRPHRSGQHRPYGSSRPRKLLLFGLCLLLCCALFPAEGGDRAYADAGWRDVSAGGGHVLAIKDDGSLWAWGSNWNGQLGIGVNTGRGVPTRIGADTDWKAVSAGGSHSLGIKNDGSLWAWGSNSHGELGDGTGGDFSNDNDKSTPVRVGSDNDWQAVSAGRLHSLAIKDDGSLWAWGGNWDGQLGDGTRQSRCTPTYVDELTAPDFAPDAYEPDDTAEQAKAITTNGVSQERTFHSSGDIDWVKFDAVAGNTYVIETFQNGTYDVDTFIELYDDPADMPIGYDDDGGTDDWCSKISWAAGKDAVMYVKVYDYDDDIGAYRISVTEQDTVSRVYGADRFQTAIEVSKRNFKSADAIILATGMNYADALSASALAGALEAPLLLTKPGALSNGILQEADRLGATEVYIIGSTAAVSGAVEAELSGAGLSVERIAGADRYATSAAIAQKVADLEGEYFIEKAFLTRGDNFADGLAVSPLAYSNRIPVILTQPMSLSAPAANTITGLGIADVVILGSNAAVSDSVERAVRGLSTHPTVKRVAGADRYETSQRIAAYAFANYLAWQDFVGVATGLDFPDALAGGVAAGERGGILVLTDPNKLSPIWAGYLAGAYAYGTPSIQIYGGPNVVSDNVMSKLQEIFLD